MNKTILIGRLTKEPEKQSTQSGTTICSFNLAVDRPFTNDQTDFINCKVFNKGAENLCLYCHKGSQIAVEGRIQTGSYTDKSGNKKYTVDVIADRILFLDSKTKEHNAENDIEVTQQEDPYESMGDEVKLEDSDLPFDFD